MVVEDLAMNCPGEIELERYFDGVITDGSLREEIAAHVVTCANCARELERMERLSGLLNPSAMGLEGLSEIGGHRLHHRVDDVMGRGIVRLAWALSGVAASVLVAGSALLMTMKTPVPQQAAPPWVEVAAVASSQQGLGPDGRTPAAQWYLADASLDELP